MLAPLKPFAPLAPGTPIGLTPRQGPAGEPLPTYDEDEERSLLSRLGTATLSGLGYVGMSLDKMFGGRAIRGLMGGKPRELLSLIPFSDSAGFTDPEDVVYGRELLEKGGILGENTPGFDMGDVAGFAADVLLDPATYINPLSPTKFGRALQKRGHLTGTLGDQVRGADYLESQVARLEPANKAGVAPDQLIPDGRTMIPAAVAKAVEAEVGGKLVPRFNRIARPAVDQPNPFNNGLSPAGPPPPVADFDDALFAAQSGFTPPVGRYIENSADQVIGNTTRDSYRALDVLPGPVQGADAVRLTERALADRATKNATPLRAAIGIGLPFMDPIATFGTGPRTAAALDMLSGFGTALKKTAPARYARALFSNPVDRTTTFPVQELAAGVKRPREEELLAEMYGQLFDATKEMEPVFRKGVNDEANRLLYMASEGIPIPKNVTDYKADLAARFPDDYARMKADGTLNALERQYALIERTAQNFGGMNKTYLQGEQGLGINTLENADDSVNYMQRILNPLPPEGRLLARIFGSARQALGGTHTAQIGRNQLFTGIPEGTVQFNEMVRAFDPVTARPLFTGKERTLSNAAAAEQIRKHLTRTPGDVTSGFTSATHFVDEAEATIQARNLLHSPQEAQDFIAKYNVTNPAQQAQILQRGEEGEKILQAALAKQKAINEQASGLAEYLGALNPKYAKQNFFKTDPLLSMQVRGAKSAKSRAGAEAFYKGIKGIAKPESAFEPGTSVAVRDVVHKAGLNFQDPLKYGKYSVGEVLTAKALGVDVDTLKNWHIPDDVGNDMVKWLKGWSKPDELAPVIAGYDAATNLTKAWLTVPFPAFHTRNLMTGVFNMWRDGALDAEAMRMAIDVLTGRGLKGLAGFSKDPMKAMDELLRESYSNNVAFRAGTRHTGDIMRTAAGTAEAELASIPGRVVKSNQEIAEAVGKFARPAKDFAAGEQKVQLSRWLSDNGYNNKEIVGLLKSAMPGARTQSLYLPKAAMGEILGDTVFGSAKRGAKRAVEGSTWKPWAVAGFDPKGEGNTLMRLARSMGNTSEDFLRLAHYIAKRKQGFTAAEAARGVRKYHFDYGDVTPFERGVMKRLIPFYSFSSKNLPPLLEDLVKRPAKLAASIRGATIGSREDDTFVPPHIAEGTNVVLPGAPEGYARYIASFGLPFEDEFFKAMGSASGGDFSRAAGQAMGGLNPFVKLPIEQATGVQLHSGRQLRDLQPSWAGDLAGLGDDETARTMTQLLANTPASRLISSVEKLKDERKGIGVKMANLLTGARITDVDLGKQQEIAARAALQDFPSDRPAVKTFEDVYVKPENLERLSKQELALYALYKQLQKRSQKRTAEEKKASAPQRIGVRMP
jgi:hypothetical protein